MTKIFRISLLEENTTGLVWESIINYQVLYHLSWNRTKGMCGIGKSIDTYITIHEIKKFTGT